MGFVELCGELKWNIKFQLDVFSQVLTLLSWKNEPFSCIQTDAFKMVAVYHKSGIRYIVFSQNDLFQNLGLPNSCQVDQAREAPAQNCSPGR